MCAGKDVCVREAACEGQGQREQQQVYKIQAIMSYSEGFS